MPGTSRRRRPARPAGGRGGPCAGRTRRRRRAPAADDTSGGDRGQPDDDAQRRPEAVERRRPAGGRARAPTNSASSTIAPEAQREHRDRHDDERQHRPDDRVEEADDEAGQEGVDRPVDVEVVEDERPGARGRRRSSPTRPGCARRPAAGRGGPRPVERRLGWLMAGGSRRAVRRRTQGVNEPPGASTRSPSSRPAAASSARKRWAGVSSQSGRRSPTGLNVPQWTGTTRPGRMSSVARAAVVGSRWPSPSVGPQPQIGSRATSTGAHEPISSNRSVSPAK